MPTYKVSSIHFLKLYTAVCCVLIFWISAFANYNEIYDETGAVRPAYVNVYNIFNSISQQEREVFLQMSKIAFRGDNMLDPVPRIISNAEYENILKPGVEQRAKALLAFLKDYYSGAKKYIKAGIIPERIVQSLLFRYNETGYKNKIRPEDISFFYGPDIIRDEKGTWRVIEDNPGFIGGLGDLRLAQNFLLQKFPQYQKEIAFNRSEIFYEELTKIYKKNAKGKAVVMYMTPPYADNEDQRLRRIFADYGIKTVTPYSIWQLQINPTTHQVFLWNTKEKEMGPEVGYVVLNGEHSWLDPNHPLNFNKAILLEAKEHFEDPDVEFSLKKKLSAELSKKNPNITKIYNWIENDSNLENGVKTSLKQTKAFKGLTEAIFSGKVKSNYSPGIDFIGDKEFYVYVESMIRFYLQEEPILKNIETDRLADDHTLKLNESLFFHVFKNIDQYVIKKVDGRGGDGVWVGPKLNSQELPELKKKILQDPTQYIVQKYTPLSIVGENIVDLRVISHVDNKNIFVTNSPWGRGLPASGNGKVNLSDQGREYTVLISHGPANLCQNIFLH
ncbi:MAG: circularly permuted type 2 ATP-grasp protein [Pseudobdellovibrionaceae bacterium]